MSAALPLRAHHLWVLAAVLAAAFNLRAGIVIVGPLIDEIRSDTGMSSAVAGALTTIPFFCLGLFAFLGPPLVRRFGYRMVVLVALLLIALGSLGRAAAPTGALMIATTLPIGLGIALVGVTLPAVVKSQFPERGGLVTGAYISFLSIGIITVGLGLVPLADALGGWREAFALSAIPPAVAAVLWIRRDAFAEGGPAMSAAGSEVPPSAVAAAPGRLRDRIRPDRTALLLGLTCGLQSVAFAGMVSWGPARFQEAGWSEHEAAMVLTAIGLCTVVAALTMLPASEGTGPPVLAARHRAGAVGGPALDRAGPHNHVLALADRLRPGQRRRLPSTARARPRPRRPATGRRAPHLLDARPRLPDRGAHPGCDRRAA